MGPKRKPRKDWYRAAQITGHFPLNFNFVFARLDKAIQCSYCGKPVYEKNLTRDHVYPKSKGGIVKTPCCLQCNIRKEDMKPIEFAVWFSKHGFDLSVIPIGSETNLEED